MDVVQAFLRAAKSRNTHISVHVDFAVSTAGDGDISTNIIEFQPDGTRNVQRAVKAAGDGGAHGTAHKREYHGEQRDGCGQFSLLRHESSNANGGARSPFPK